MCQAKTYRIIVHDSNLAKPNNFMARLKTSCVLKGNCTVSMPAQAVACTKCQAIAVYPTGPHHSTHMYEPLQCEPL
jgi:ribosomal protein S27E